MSGLLFSAPGRGTQPRLRSPIWAVIPGGATTLRWLPGLKSISPYAVRDSLSKEVAREAREVCALLASMKVIKQASSDKELHFYVDPRLAGKYKINLHLMRENDEDEVVSAGPADDGKTVVAKVEKAEDFREDTVTFASKKTSDPNYLCSVVLQKPEGKVYAVSVYVTETYLGRYAFKANYYFREASQRAANRCFERVVRAVRELRQDMIEDDVVQVKVPYLLRKRLSGLEGEVEPKINQMATYLNPDNVGTANPDAPVASYLPQKRSISEDLSLGG